jgi:hypothetical protein
MRSDLAVYLVVGSVLILLIRPLRTKEMGARKPVATAQWSTWHGPDPGGTAPSQSESADPYGLPLPWLSLDPPYSDEPGRGSRSAGLSRRSVPVEHPASEGY